MMMTIKEIKEDYKRAGELHNNRMMFAMQKILEDTRLNEDVKQKKFGFIGRLKVEKNYGDMYCFAFYAYCGKELSIRRTDVVWIDGNEADIALALLRKFEMWKEGMQ